MARIIDKVVIHHSSTPISASLPEAINSFDINHAARLHLKPNGYGYHIAYHYVIAGDGSYKATRPHEEIGYHATDYSVNESSIGICFVGDFTKESPTQRQYDTANKILDMLDDEYDFTIHGHKEFSETQCPGDNIDLSLFKGSLMKKHKLEGFRYWILAKMNSFLYNRVKDQRVKESLHKTNEIIRGNI